MITLPELCRLKLQLLYDEIEVQMIKVRSKKHCLSLVFDHLSRSSTFSHITMPVMQSHLFALLYEMPETKTPTRSFLKLEKLLRNDQNEYELGIFHEPMNNFANIFIAVHLDHPGLFSRCFRGAKVALFKFSYQDLMEDDHEKHISYLNEIKRYNQNLSKSLSRCDQDLESLSFNVETLKNQIKDLNCENLELTGKSETARKTIKILYDKLKIDDFQKLECQNCKVLNRNVIFLPCGHLIICKNCFIFKYNFQVNVIFGQKLVKCPACRIRINEAREVFF